MSVSLRDALRERAGARCEYCRMPERLAALRFQQDHVVALKHRGATAPENLAWSCADCNAHKGSNLAGIDPHREAGASVQPAHRSLGKTFRVARC